MQQLLLCAARNRLGPLDLFLKKEKKGCVTFHRGMAYVTFHGDVGGSLGVLRRHNDQKRDRGPSMLRRSPTRATGVE